jgi:thiamine biosynthesis lipoprotein
MGTDVHVVVCGGRERALIERACARVHELEQRWSRFLPESEISRFNRAPVGTPCLVSEVTLHLVATAKRAWELTGGLYDPTVLPALRAAGYDDDFGRVRVRADDGCAVLAPRAPGCAGLVIDSTVGTLTKRDELEFDPGGVGKGLTADLVSRELLHGGATGALVNVGGDIRVRGDAPDGPTWSIRVENAARPDADVMCVGLEDGAVATSTNVKRRWVRGGAVQHHLIDPRTGLPARSRFVAVTAVTTDAWWAEIAAKVTFIASLSPQDLALPAALVAAVDARGEVTCSAELTPLVEAAA